MLSKLASAQWFDGHLDWSHRVPLVRSMRESHAYEASTVQGPVTCKLDAKLRT